jgi:hypothetical protein
MDPSGRIEHLLRELKGSLSPQSWQRIDGLMQAVVELYGQALERILSTLDASARHGLAADPLVASVMALHGLHPLPVETRIARALDDLPRELGVFTLTSVKEGVAHLQAAQAAGAPWPALGAQARDQITELVTEAAPELLRVELDDRGGATASGPLVQIDLARSRARADHR